MRSVAVFALATLSALSSCAPREHESVDEASPEVEGNAVPVRGDWLVIWLLSDPESLNPLTSNDIAAGMVLGPIQSSLLGTDPKTLETMPIMAEALPEVAADHLTYTFRLRSGLNFSDGKPVTVDDILFALKAIKNPEVNAPHLRNYFISVIDARKLDERTIQFRCSEPYFRNDTVLGGIPALPRHFYDPNGELEPITVADLAHWETIDSEKKERALRFARAFNVDYHRKVLGAGAYVMSDAARDLITGERVVLRHRDGFWAPGDALRGDGWVDRIVYRIINNQDAALVSLKSGNLDLMGLWRGLTPLQHTKQTDTPGFRARFRKEIAYSPGYVYLGWNQRRAMFRERKLRQAIAHFVDRDRIIEKVLLGLGEKIDSPVYRFRPEYNEDIRGYPFDPVIGRRLLDEAGWIDRNGDGIREKVVNGVTTPLRFEIISNAGNDIRRNVGLIVIDALRRSGIDASFRDLDWTILLEKVKNFDYDAVILGWGMSVNDPDLYQLWHSSQAVSGGSNHVAFENADADRIMVDYRREFDEEKRIEMYRRLQEIIHEEAPYVFLFMEKTISAVDRRFRNTVWYPTGGPNTGEWWVPPSLQRYG